jgi:hypothetical protein
MSIRMSKGGRLFGIMAGLGGAAMSGGARLSWAYLSHGYPSYAIELRDADRRAMLVLGLLVITGAACFITLGSRRMRMAAGALVLLASGAGLVIAFTDTPLLTGSEVRCSYFHPCLQSVREEHAPVLAGLGAVVAAGFGIVALLRSGGEALATHAAGRPAAVTSGAGPSGDLATPPERRMSDLSLLVWIVVAVVIALVAAFVVALLSICSDPTEWC